jgi:hypothetical protein
MQLLATIPTHYFAADRASFSAPGTELKVAQPCPEPAFCGDWPMESSEAVDRRLEAFADEIEMRLGESASVRREVHSPTWRGVYITPLREGSADVSWFYTRRLQVDIGSTRGGGASRSIVMTSSTQISFRNSWSRRLPGELSSGSLATGGQLWRSPLPTEP